MLWMPDSWGRIDEDGEFVTLKSTLAAMFALFGGGSLINFIDRAQRTRFVLVLLQEEVEYERKIHATMSRFVLALLQEEVEYERKILVTMSLTRLDELKSDLEGKIEGLNREPHRKGEMTEKHIFGEGVPVASHRKEKYRNLIQLVEERKRLVEKAG